ncbi:MAG: protein translocase subunit SecF [Candidatus Pacebacteria bacterium]|nr:protein translocase subunit SecF [Candidatus Paceibacterota bacterium]
MLIVKYRKIFYALTTLLILASIGSIAIFGLNFGIDFTGGTIVEFSYEGDVPTKERIDTQLGGLGMGEHSLRASGESGFILRTPELSEEARQDMIEALAFDGEFEVLQERVNTIGPVIGNELKNKALVAIVIVVFAIILFVAFAFRKVSEPVSSWKYGLIAIFALLHDILIPVGVFALLGHYVGSEVNVLFVTALLAILGYSVNDTIVVFDRVRENLKQNRDLHRKEDFELTVGKSLTQTYTRSVNTSLTTAFALLTLFFIGAPATQDFALVLLVGIIAGTYSSIALATPLLVTWAGKEVK